MKFYNSIGPNPRVVKMFMAEKGIDVPRGTTRVIRQRHRGAAEHVDVRDHAALSQPVTEPSEGLFDALAAE